MEYSKTSGLELSVLLFRHIFSSFVKVDNLSYKEAKQSIESFIWCKHPIIARGTQAPFSNITLDWTVPADLAELPAIVGGKEMDFTYRLPKRMI